MNRKLKTSSQEALPYFIAVLLVVGFFTFLWWITQPITTRYEVSAPPEPTAWNDQ